MSWLYDYKAQFSLGILYLSSILKEEGWEVSVFDTNINSIKTIPFSDVYGFSVVYNTYSNCTTLAAAIKQKYTNSCVIAGGVHATLNKANLNPIFDSVFVGEAEETIKIFSNDFKNGSYLKLYISKGPVDISKLIPDRSLLSDEYIRTKSIFTDKKDYDNNGSTSIMFSRGCPYNCVFCGSPKIYGKSIRYRPIESISQEIQGIIETYGIRQYRVQDDTFTINMNYLRDLCNEVKKHNIFYRCSTRVNHVNDETVKHLYESGCREIGIGIETADNEILKKLKKQITLEQAVKAITCIRKYPITLRCFFMIGTPFDSYDLMYKDINFIEKQKIDNAMFANFIPFPGTEMFDEKEKYNIKGVKEKTCMNIAPHIKFGPNILRYDISEEEHTKIMRVMYDYLISKKWI